MPPKERAQPDGKKSERARESGGLPSGWIRLAIGDVGRWFGGGTPSKANPRFWTGGNIPWVSPKDMKFDHITDPGVLALEITEDLEAALEQFAAIAEDLKR